MEMESFARIADILSGIETALSDIAWQLRQQNEKRELTEAESNHEKREQNNEH